MIPKFRAWDEDNKKWCDDFCIELSTGQLLCDHGKTMYIQEIILEQSTGLKDKHGKEIFEGDKLKGQFLTEPGVVVFCYGTFMLDYKGAARNCFTKTEIIQSEFEIIGTIHDKEKP